jgi:hypothetical protein
MAEFLRAQAAWRLARAGTDPVRAARCAAALLDAAAFVVTLAGDDAGLAVLAHAGCFGGEVFDPGARGLQIARWWQFGDPPYAGPRDLLAALAAAAIPPSAASPWRIRSPEPSRRPSASGR